MDVKTMNSAADNLRVLIAEMVEKYEEKYG